MNRLNYVLTQQIQRLLSDTRYASLCAVLLAVLPYVGWVALVVIALITLRKGYSQGFNVLMPVMVIHFATSLVSLPTMLAGLNTATLFIPCYFAACILRMTTNWRSVARLFFLLGLIVALALQLWMPDFIRQQFLYVRALMHDLQAHGVLLDLLQSSDGIDDIAFSNYLFGIQLLSIAVATVFPMLVARSLQSRFFYPEGFRQEMLSFRGSKIEVLILAVLLFAAFQGYVIAMNLLPLFIGYFVLAGLSLSANALVLRHSRTAFLILLLPLVLLPFVMLPIFVILGTLDSLFDLRGYFAQA